MMMMNILYHTSIYRTGMFMDLRIITNNNNNKFKMNR